MGIFFHFLFDSVFFEYQETLDDYKSFGIGGGKEGGFCFNQNGFHLRNSKHIHEPKLLCSHGRDTGSKKIVLNPFPGLCLLDLHW